VKTVCFVSLHAYPVVQPSAPGIFGGTETRAVTLAQGLAATGEYEVRFLARHPQLTQPTKICGVTWLPWLDFWGQLRAHASQFIAVSQRFPWVHLTGWSWHLLWELPFLAAAQPFRIRRDSTRKQVAQLQRLNADLFLTFGVNSGSATVVYNARTIGKPSLLFLGSNSDVSEGYRSDSTDKNLYGERSETCYWQLQNATVLVAQNEFQQQKLTERFDRESVLIRNPIDERDWKTAVQEARTAPLPAELEPLGESLKGQGYLLWIGRAETYHKRAQLAIEVARQCPDIPFVMVLNPRGRQTEAEIVQQLPGHVTRIKQVPFAAMPALFAHARLYLNTSSAKYEGFPNVFLQAAAAEVPIVSLEVAPEFLEASGAGVCLRGDLGQVTPAIRDCLQQNAANPQKMQQAAAWVRDHYALESAIDRLRQQIEHLLAEPD